MNSHGDKRENAGRRLGSNAYGESTVPMRVPKSQVTKIKDFLKIYANKGVSGQSVFHEYIRRVLVPKEAGGTPPLFSSKVAAGFPSTADYHVEKRLDINDYLIEQADATFLVTVTGLSMRDAGLLPKDIAIVDRSKVALIGVWSWLLLTGNSPSSFLV